MPEDEHEDVDFCSFQYPNKSIFNNQKYSTIHCQRVSVHQDHIDIRENLLSENLIDYC